MLRISSCALPRNCSAAVRDGNVVALHLDLRHAVHFHRHAFARINFRRLHINRQQFEREHVHLFENRQDERAAAFDDAEADRRTIFQFLFASRHDQHLVRADLGVTAEDHVKQQEHDDDDDDRRDDADAALDEVQLGEHGDKVDLHNDFGLVSFRSSNCLDEKLRADDARDFDQLAIADGRAVFRARRRGVSRVADDIGDFADAVFRDGRRQCWLQCRRVGRRAIRWNFACDGTPNAGTQTARPRSPWRRPATTAR